MLDQAAPDFSDPIGLLQACHGRIQKQCQLLRKMCAYQERHGVDDELISDARGVLRYFDIAAPLHHADEERDLFPALAGIAELQPLMQQLTREHKEHDALWHTLRRDLEEIAGGSPCGRLREHSEPFIRAQLAHIAIENESLLPRAREVLDAGSLAQIGDAMARRRLAG
jgi:hemerythrin-like domain-containing protein